MKHFIIFVLIIISCNLFSDTIDNPIGFEKAKEVRYTQIGKLKETIFEGKNWQLTLNIIESEYTKESVKKLFGNENKLYVGNIFQLVFEQNGEDKIFWTTLAEFYKTPRAGIHGFQGSENISIYDIIMDKELNEIKIIYMSWSGILKINIIDLYNPNADVQMKLPTANFFASFKKNESIKTAYFLTPNIVRVENVNGAKHDYIFDISNVPEERNGGLLDVKIIWWNGIGKQFDIYMLHEKGKGYYSGLEEPVYSDSSVFDDWYKISEEKRSRLIEDTEKTNF